MFIARRDKSVARRSWDVFWEVWGIRRRQPKLNNILKIPVSFSCYLSV